VDSWLQAASAAIADATDRPREAVQVSEEAAETLLELARIAAHESGDRRNAPLLTYLMGLAAASDPDRLGRAAAAVRVLLETPPTG
jgi:hypothetical protein